MIKRNPALVFVFGLFTGGIYSLVWSVQTKGEMVREGAEIPTAWLLIVPFVNFYWLWKWAHGVEKVTKGTMGAAVAFLLELLLGPIGDAVIQSAFNKTVI